MQKQGRSLRVALVNMPFSSARFPSMQLGLLQSILTQHGFSATSHYLNLDYAARVGWKHYEKLSDNTLCFIGDWLFARAAFRESAPDGMLYLRRFGRKLNKNGATWLFREHEKGAREFLESCVTSAPWHQYDVVGFSSVFVQNCAALALARLLKERHPHLITVFGGANFEDEMGLEYVRVIPWIDYAVLGEADKSFPDLLSALAAGENVGERPGIAYRKDGKVVFGGHAPLIRNLDDLPIPNYDDYFLTAARLHMPNALVANGIQLPYESARGCWWGEKQHCTFCGLNAMGMSYRSKSPSRILNEIDTLVQRYRTRYLGAVDNILDHRHIDGVFGTLADQRKDYKFFYEVKANLRQDQIRKLAKGGMRRVQPGIESLNTHILELMKKGVTGIENLRLMKWATYYGVSVSWNLLLGFPGETADDYTQQVDLFKLIPHFPPPSGAFRISLERFSPNFTKAREMGFENVRPFEGYSYIYPKDLDKGRIAYFFEYKAKGTLPDAAYLPLHQEVARWQQRWRGTSKPRLIYGRDDKQLAVLDGRSSEPRIHRFSGLAADVYEFCCSTDRSAANVREHFSDASSASIDEALTKHLSLGLMYREGDKYLSLAIPNRAGL